MIHHELDYDAVKIDFEVEPEVLRFLNDDAYLGELEYAASKINRKAVNCLDLSPFPYVGLLLLKDHQLEKLWCHKKNEKLIKLIASKNVIAESSLEFVDDAAVHLGTKFQLIIVHPIHPLGDFDNQVLCDYQKYKQLLSEGGLIIPKKITLFGELINSEWLMQFCRITDVGVQRLKVNKFINSYATVNHLDLDYSLDCERLSNAFKISEIFFDDELHEKTFEVPMRNINLPIHAILYHHMIQLVESSPEFSTNRKSKSSSFKRAAQILTKELTVNATGVTVSFMQNSGIVKCDVLA
jgi:hypothetical protein